ncbi:MAG: L,D-transpeptidase family protein [Berryella intestinalis]|nr:L,D-transpeptidase family protein [Berryella intestinalis]
MVPLVDPTKKKKRMSSRRVAAIVLASFFGVILAVYLAGAAVFSYWFYPGTTIGRIDASLQSSDQVSSAIDSSLSAYKVRVSGGGFSYEADSSAAGIRIDSDAVVASMHERLDSFRWPLEVFKRNHDLSDLLVASYNSTELGQSVQAAVDAFNETADAPTNAQVVYDADKRSFVIEPEKTGTQLNAHAVMAAVSRAVVSMSDSASIGQAELEQPAVRADDPRVVAAHDEATTMSSAVLRLVTEGKELMRIDSNSISDLVSISDEYEVTFDDSGLSDSINEIIASYNTVGTKRHYTRPDGKQVSVEGGVYGWRVDTRNLYDQIVEGVKEGAQKDIEISFASTGSQASVNGGPDWGSRYVDVDLSEQYARFYDDGSIIWEADFVSGEADGKHNTPTGVWWVNAKESPSTLVGYEGKKKLYSTKVQYWIPFEGNSIGFHDAPWQAKFGGTRYKEGFGSHGCINLEPSKAAELYKILHAGDCVVVHY